MASGSSTSGFLIPTEYEEVEIETDPGDLPDGEYTDSFYVEAEGDGYSYSKKVTLTLLVGYEEEPEGPEIYEISTNTGPEQNQIIIQFDKTLDEASANNPARYKISPSIEVLGAEVEKDFVILSTESHVIGETYTLEISSIKDRNDVESKDLSTRYRFYQCCAGPDLSLSGTEEEYAWDNLLTGKRFYTGNIYRISAIPSVFDACALLKTSFSDVRNENLEISFPIHCQYAKVYLAVDPKMDHDWNCSWIRHNYRKLEDSLYVTGMPGFKYLDIYESLATFRDGERVTLLQNGAPPEVNAGMYLVLVKAVEATPGVAGQVKYYASPHKVDEVYLNLTAASTDTVITDTSGTFLFESLESGLTYTLIPAKSGNVPRHAILMHDAAIAAQIASERILASSDEQNIAADVNEDGEVTFADAWAIAAYSVGLSDDSAAGIGEWRFNPPQRVYSDLDSTEINQDFAAIVLGDADGNWGAAFDAMRAPVLKGMPWANQITNGPNQNSYNFEVIPSAATELISFYIELKYDPAEVEFSGFSANKINSDFKLFKNNDPDGTLKIGCFSANPVQINDTFLNLSFNRKSQNSTSGFLTIKTCMVDGEFIWENAETTYSAIVEDHQLKICRLLPNYPNPFNPETMINYEISHSQAKPVSIVIYNVRGEQVKALLQTHQSAGHYTVRWDGKTDAGHEASSGIYLVILKTEGFSQSRKLLKVK